MTNETSKHAPIPEELVTSIEHGTRHAMICPTCNGTGATCDNRHAPLHRRRPYCDER